MPKAKTRTELESEEMARYLGCLVGLKIAKVLPMTDKEVGQLAWHQGGVIIMLEDGTTVLPMRDPEGNGPGHLEITRP